MFWKFLVYQIFRLSNFLLVYQIFYNAALHSTDLSSADMEGAITEEKDGQDS